MEDTMKVLRLLEELEDIVDEATGLPLSNKIMLDSEEIFQIVREIRLALPDDVQQAKWIRDERDRILEEAKTEYERIIREAKKQADYLVETDDITLRATKLAGEKFIAKYIGSRWKKALQKRKDIYQAFMKHLLEQGLAYPCFCSSDDLAKLRCFKNVKAITLYDKSKTLNKIESEIFEQFEIIKSLTSCSLVICAINCLCCNSSKIPILLNTFIFM